MLDLALHREDGPTSLSDIAQRQEISLSYLEQLFAKLRKGALVSSVRGPGGGYHLARQAGDINVAEIIAAVDEVVDTTRCNGGHDCHCNGPCLTHDLWEDLGRSIYDYLSRITLEDLVERKCAQQAEKTRDQPRAETRLEVGRATARL
jgi:Rrf2 family iron-sulfur cluster assembly transcriptional regulator